MRTRDWVACWVLTGVLACSSKVDSSSGGAGTSACDPLQSKTTSVTLDAASIVAAGRALDGTVYVLTEQHSEMRLFVGSGSALAEQFELGTGTDTESGTQTWLFDYAAADGSPISVEAQRDASGLRMGVLMGPKSGKTWQVGGQGETLTLLSAADAAALSAQTTQTFNVDFAGVRADGTALVLVAPAHSGDFASERLFWGMPGALAEEKILSFTRSLNNDTIVTFALGSGMANLTYSISFVIHDAGSTTSIQGSVTVDGETSELMTSWPPVAPAGAQYLCR